MGDQLGDFAHATAVEEVADGHFVAVLDPDWSIGGKAHGGYLMAVVARAAAAGSAHDDVLAASTQFLRAPDPGRADIRVEMLRRGRTVSQVRATLSQAGEVCLDSSVTVGTLDPMAAPYWSSVSPLRIADFENCLRVPPMSPVGVAIPMMKLVDLRVDRDAISFADAPPSGSGTLRGWLDLGVPFDPVSLLYAVDAMPPATFEVEPTGWVPTMQLSAYVRANPAPGPVQILHQANLIQGQRVDETCTVWDSLGRLVAQSTQLAGIRLG